MPKLVLVSLLVLLTACQSTESWTWQRAEDGLPRQAIITAVAVAPDNPDVLWAGSYAAGGLATSRDGGQTWVTDAAGVADNPVFDLLALGEESAWAATRDGLLFSSDAGANWRLTEGLPTMPVFAVTADANRRLYAGLDAAGVYAQTESGWESLAGDDTLASAGVLSLAVAPDGQTLYAGTSGDGLFVSPNGGDSWQQFFPTLYAPNIALNPTDPNIALASLRTQLVRTEDSGASWRQIVVPWGRDEVVSLLWLDDGAVGVGTSRGQVYLSRNNGDSWVEGGAGLPEGSGILDLARGPDGRLLAGTWTGVYASDTNGESWHPLAPSLGAVGAHVLGVYLNRAALGTQAGFFTWDRGQWFADSFEWPVGGITTMTHLNALIYAGTNNGLYHPSSKGPLWQRRPTPNVGITAIAIDPKNPSHLYILAAWERVYESKDGGATWKADWDGMDTTVETVSIAVDPMHNFVYVGAEQGLYRKESSQPWELVAPTLTDQSVLALLVEQLPAVRGGETVLYLGATRGIYRSLDQGLTAQGSPRWGRGLENRSVTALVAHPTRPNTLAAGTAFAGLYESTDGGQTWHAIGTPEMDSAVIESLAWHPDGTLFVAAPQGVWRGFRE